MEKVRYYNMYCQFLNENLLPLPKGIEINILENQPVKSYNEISEFKEFIFLINNKTYLEEKVQEYYNKKCKFKYYYLDNIEKNENLIMIEISYKDSSQKNKIKKIYTNSSKQQNTSDLYESLELKISAIKKKSPINKAKFTLLKDNFKKNSIKSINKYHDYINRYLLDHFKIENKYSYAYLPNRSIKDNAQKHLNAKFMLKLDFKSFFKSITYDSFKEHYTQNFKVTSSKYKENSSDMKMLSAIKVGCFIEYNNDLVLPIGYKTSPNISNIYMITFDELVGKYCDYNNIIYIRYSDDCTFSSEYYFDYQALKKYLENIIYDYYKDNLKFNDSKEIFLDESKRKFVTGVILEENRLKIANSDIKDLFNMMLLFYTIIHNCFGIAINDFHVLNNDRDKKIVIDKFQKSSFLFKHTKKYGVLYNLNKKLDILILSENFLDFSPDLKEKISTEKKYKLIEVESNAVKNLEYDLQVFKGKIYYFLSINEYDYMTYKCIQLYNQLVYGIRRDEKVSEKNLGYKRNLILKKNMKSSNVYECIINNGQYVALLLFYRDNGFKKYIIILPEYYNTSTNIKSLDIKYEYITKTENFINIREIKSNVIKNRKLHYICGYFSDYLQFFLKKEYPPISFFNIDELYYNFNSLKKICKDKFKHNDDVLDIVEMIEIEELKCVMKKAN